MVSLILASILFVTLQLLDWLTTGAGIVNGIPEGNPVMIPILERYGIAGLFWVKLVITSVVLSTLWLPEMRQNPKTNTFLWMMCGFYMFVIGWNLNMIGVI